MQEMVELPPHIDGLVTRERQEDLMHYEASKSVPFITAAWASVGLAILSSVVSGSPSGISRFLAEHLHVALPFVVGVYVASYVGGRWLMRTKIRENVFASIAASFLVAEGVLFAGSVLGSIGGLIKEVATSSSYIDFSEFLVAPFMMAFFGGMFCLPLAIGLGAHIRLWSLWKRQKVAISELESTTPPHTPSLPA